MTHILATHIGNYPRIGNEKDRQRLRRALNHLQNKEISSHAFHDVEQSVIQEVTREQISAGLDQVTHGHISWQDPIFHFCRKTKGIRPLGLKRYFHTNTYYRVPQFASKPRRTGTCSAGDFEFAQKISSSPVRAVLTGPLTLAAHSIGETKPFHKFEARTAYFSELLLQEIKELNDKGAKFIQIDEPVFPQIPEKERLLKTFLDSVLSTADSAEISLAFYFEPAKKILKRLPHLPAHCFFLDFLEDGKKTLDDLLSIDLQQTIGFGLVNGQETKRDPVDGVIRLIKTWIEKKAPKKVYIAPNSGLEYLPRDQAFEKIKLLAKIKFELQQELGGGRA